MRAGVLVLTVLTVVTASCASPAHLHDPLEFTSNKCHTQFRTSLEKEADEQLDHVSELFQMGCDREVIAFAQLVRASHRDKFYSVTAEMGELLTPEGRLTPYTLESFERSFLSLVMAASHFRLGEFEAARVELRRTEDEQKAQLYNNGEDPVIELLLAAMWDRFDSGMARPHWRRFTEMFDRRDPRIAQFARDRIKAIDQGDHQPVDWEIYGIGHMPPLNWQAQFFSARPYLITPAVEYPGNCSTADDLLLSTQSWADKIASRYDSDYHPVLLAKSLLRLPIGLGYGLIGISGGAAVGVGGCVAATQVRSGGDQVCKASLEAAGYLIERSTQLVEFTLQPDLRRWKALPAAVWVKRLNAHSCAVATETITLPLWR